jgi:hypothetical protein
VAALRMASFAKYLNEQTDIELDVLCPQWEGNIEKNEEFNVFYTHQINGDVVYSAPNTSVLQRIKFFAKSLLKWDARKSVKPGIFSENCKRKWADLAHRNYHFVLGSYGPADVFHFLYWLKGENPDIIVIADYRDHWSFNRYQDYGWFRPIIRNTERRLLLRFDAVITVSQTIADTLYTNGMTTSRPSVVYNGFSPEIGFDKNSVNPHLIVHTGALYGGKRSCGAYFKWLHQNNLDAVYKHTFIAPEINDRKYLENVISASGVKQVVVLDKLSYQETRIWQQKAAFGLLVLSESGFDEEYLPVKMYEYIGAGIPIVFCGNTEKSEAYRLIKNFGIGDHFSNFDFNHPEKYQFGMKQAQAEFSRERQANSLSEIIGQLCSRSVITEI